MITKEQVIPLLFETCPEIEQSSFWQQNVKDWGDMEDPVYYLDAAAVADYVVDKYKKGDKESFPAFFSFIEKLHLDGDHYVKELATSI